MLELRDLARRYGDVVALDGISFTVERGQMFGFVGPNGAGKTTAMRIVLGVLAADRGEVLFQGRPVDFETRARFGYMPEDCDWTCVRGIGGVRACPPCPSISTFVSRTSASAST